VQLSLTNCCRCARFYPIFAAVPNAIMAFVLLVGFESSPGHCIQEDHGITDLEVDY
jgi:hypothetical protein